MIVSFLEESVPGFNNIRNGKVKTKFEIVDSDNFETCLSKNIIFPSVTFWYIDGLMGRIFPKFQPPIDLQDSVALVKSL